MVSSGVGKFQVIDYPDGFGCQNMISGQLRFKY